MNIKRLERLVAKILISASYKFFTLFPVKNKVTFATFRTTELTGNFKYIKDEIDKRGLNLKYEYLFKKFKPTLLGKADYLMHMIYSGYAMATSKFFIIDDYYFPIYVIKPREGNHIAQVWHACGAFKMFGYDVVGKGYGSSEDYLNDIKIHSNYESVIVSSKEVVKHYSSAFDTPENRISPTGIPRTDIFFSEEEKEKAKNTVYEKYPILSGKRVVLYAPTFRGKGQTDVGFNMTLDLDLISKSLPEGTIFALKMHPFVKTRVDNIDNIIDLSDYDDINHLLILADILITDYSSVIFEYSLMEKPIIMYASDYEEYIAERDFYYDYESFVPGPITKDTKGVVDLINSDNFNLDKVKEFKNKFFDHQDGESSKRFVDFFIENNL